METKALVLCCPGVFDCSLDATAHSRVVIYQMWANMGDDVLHIELRRWADVLVVAPLDANTLGKLSNGLSDNLLTCVARVRCR